MSLLSFLLRRRKTDLPPADMRFLIACLGNIGPDYEGTRHNAGFLVADALAAECGVPFEDKRYGFVAKAKVKNAELLLLKPSTFMNLSGNAVRYWMDKARVPVERLLVVADDLSLPLGTLRLKPGGSAAGHNGLKHIAQTLGTETYARLRIGLGSDFPRGGQIDFVLGRFTDEELPLVHESVERAREAVKAFALSGVQFAMNHFNRK